MFDQPVSVAATSATTDHRLDTTPGVVADLRPPISDRVVIHDHPDRNDPVSATDLDHQPHSDPGSAAMGYAAAGIPVLPLHTPTRWGCSCQRGAGCPSPGKHPRLRHGLHQASLDARVIGAWWRRWPEANLGLLTGGVLDVCDIDTPTAWHTVLTLLDNPAATPVVRTGFGWHLWFAATGAGNRVGVLPGVDWRGQGGYVVAPPSRHQLGSRYRFAQPWTATALPECPPALRRLLTPPPRRLTATPTVAVTDRYARAALDGEVGRILAAPRPVIRHGRRVRAGGRNHALHLAAFRLGQLADRGDLDEHAVTEQLSRAADLVGLPKAEASATIRSGWRAGLRHPRPPPAADMIIIRRLSRRPPPSSGTRHRGRGILVSRSTPTWSDRRSRKPARCTTTAVPRTGDTRNEPQGPRWQWSRRYWSEPL